MVRAPIVCIDAGHGGHDPGAVASDGTREADVALTMAKLLAKELGAQGADVYLTRSDDTYVDLSARAAAGKGADCFVSLHCNAAQKASGKGFSTLASSQHPLSRSLANSVQQSLAKALPMHENDGVILSPSPQYERRLYVLSQQLAPACLVEPAFLTNPEEKPWITSDAGKATAVEAIGRGVWQYLRSRRTDLAEWKDSSAMAVKAEDRDLAYPAAAKNSPQAGQFDREALKSGARATAKGPKG